MRIYQLDPESTTQKTSIMYALSRGYSLKLGDEDGSCEVTKADGAVYHVHNWRCDCPDAISRDGGSYTLPDNRNVCKHTLWTSQLYPCNCGGFAMLRMDTWKHFVCCTPGCHTMVPFQKVKAERQQARQREQEADVDKVVKFPEAPEADKAEVIRKAAEAAKAVYA